MKRIFKKGLISILILFLLVNLISASVYNISYAGDFGIGSIFNGFVGLITWAIRAPFMALLSGIHLLISGFARLGIGEIDGYGTISSHIFVTPFHVFFNRIPILDVNFFNFDGVSGTVLSFRTAVAGWYYTMRLIASMALAVILIYIGIRMAISTIASEKAMYKKMLVDWVTSLALLFLLHYIMMFTFACNDALVNALHDVCEDTDLTGFIGQLTAQAISPIDMSGAIAAMILYGIIISQTFSFIFAYTKRMLTIGFLIMIAPLITITYSIDKIGDQKAQALNTWLKEFAYNILIQPFHCIMFAAFASVAFKLIGVSGGILDELAGTSTAEAVLAICCIQFIKTGEDIVKNIFGFKNAQSLSDFATGVATKAAAIKYGGKYAGMAGAGAAKAKNFISKNTDKISNATKGLSAKVGTLSNLSNKFAYTDSKGELTARGRKKLERETEKRTDKEKQKNPSLNNQDRYAAAYQANHDKIENELKQKYKPKGEKVTEKARKRNEKEQAKDREKAVELATKRLRAKGVTRYANEEEIKSAMTQIKADKQAKIDRKAEKVERRAERAEKRSETMQKLTKPVKNITGAVGSYVSKNGDKIAATTLGVATALIGFGDGFGGALAGYNIGSGFMKGYMKNTNETLQKEISGSAQSVANMREDDPYFDMEKETYRISQIAENGGYEKVEEQLKELLNAVQGFKSKGDKYAFERDVRAQAQFNPSQFDMDFLSRTLDKYASDDANKEEMLDGVKAFASLLSESNYAKTINQTTEMTGRSIVDIANAAANSVTNVTQVNNVTYNNTTVQEGVSEQDINNLETEVGRVNQDINVLNSDTDNLRNDLNRARQEASAQTSRTPSVTHQGQQLGDNNNK